MQKKWLNVIVIAIVVLVAMYFYRKYRVAPEINLDALKVTALDGTVADLHRYHGEKVLICFAASWCGPCREELQVLSRVKEELLPDVRVIVISDEPEETIVNFKAYIGYPFEWLKLNEPFAAIGVNSIPCSFLVNRAGTVVKKTVGFIDWHDPSTAKHLSTLME
jgi:thiol-disulfide isomerase/thioredoxin